MISPQLQKSRTAFRQTRRPTDSTETASFRFARLRPQKRDSVDSVDSVVMSNRPPSGPRRFAALAPEAAVW